MTEGEIRSSDVDDIAKDMAVDYLNGEVTDDLHRAVYESIYGKVKDAKMKNAAEKFAKEKEAAAEAMGEVQKPQQRQTMQLWKRRTRRLTTFGTTC